MADYQNPYAFIDADEIEFFSEQQEHHVDPVEFLEEMDK